MKKRITAMMLSVMMAVSLLSGTVSAAEVQPVEETELLGEESEAIAENEEAAAEETAEDPETSEEIAEEISPAEDAVEIDDDLINEEDSEGEIPDEEIIDEEIIDEETSEEGLPEEDTEEVEDELTEEELLELVPVTDQYGRFTLPPETDTKNYSPLGIYVGGRPVKTMLMPVGTQEEVIPGVYAERVTEGGSSHIMITLDLPIIGDKGPMIEGNASSVYTALQQPIYADRSIYLKFKGTAILRNSSVDESEQNNYTMVTDIAVNGDLHLISENSTDRLICQMPAAKGNALMKNVLLYCGQDLYMEDCAGTVDLQGSTAGSWTGVMYEKEFVITSGEMQISSGGRPLVQMNCIGGKGLKPGMGYVIERTDNHQEPAFETNALGEGVFAADRAGLRIGPMNGEALTRFVKVSHEGDETFSSGSDMTLSFEVEQLSEALKDKGYSIRTSISYYNEDGDFDTLVEAEDVSCSVSADELPFGLNYVTYHADVCYKGDDYASYTHDFKLYKAEAEANAEIFEKNLSDVISVYNKHTGGAYVSVKDAELYETTYEWYYKQDKTWSYLKCYSQGANFDVASFPVIAGGLLYCKVTQARPEGVIEAYSRTAKLIEFEDPGQPNFVIHADDKGHPVFEEGRYVHGSNGFKLANIRYWLSDVNGNKYRELTKNDTVRKGEIYFVEADWIAPDMTNEFLIHYLNPDNPNYIASKVNGWPISAHSLSSIWKGIRYTDTIYSLAEVHNVHIYSSGPAEEPVICTLEMSEYDWNTGTTSISYETTKWYGDEVNYVTAEDGKLTISRGSARKEIMLVTPDGEALDYEVHLIAGSGGLQVFLAGEDDAHYGESRSQYVYTGKPIKPEIRVYSGGVLLTEGKDYTLSFKRNTNACSYDAVDKKGKSIAPTVVVTGKGNYSQKVEKTFTITPAAGNVLNEQITCLWNSNGQAQKVEPEVYAELKDRVVRLVKNKDYTVDLNGIDWTMPGTYQALVCGKGNYGFTKYVTVELQNKKPIDKCKVTLKNTYITYEDRIVVKDGNKTLKLGFDYTIEKINSYDNLSMPGPKSFYLKGVGEYAGLKYCTMTVPGKDIRKATVTLPKSLVYDGTLNDTDFGKAFRKLFADELLVTGADGQPLKAETDYYLTGMYDITEHVGTYEIKMFGDGNYGGSYRILKYQILPYEVKAEDTRVIVNVWDTYYQKSGLVKPMIEITDTNSYKKLVEGIDYKVTIKNTNKPGLSDPEIKASKRPTATITFMGNYKGVRKEYFDVYGGRLETVHIADKVWTPGKKGSWKNKAVVRDDTGAVLKEGKDYKLEYYTDPGYMNPFTDAAAGSGTTVYALVRGYGNYDSSMGLDTKYELKEMAPTQSMAKAKVTIKSPTYSVTGTNGAIAVPGPDDVTVTLNKKVLRPGVDYELYLLGTPNKVGTYKIWVKGVGEYADGKIASYKVSKAALSNLQKYSADWNALKSY